MKVEDIGHAVQEDIAVGATLVLTHAAGQDLPVDHVHTRVAHHLVTGEDKLNNNVVNCCKCFVIYILIILSSSQLFSCRSSGRRRNTIIGGKTVSGLS